MLEPGAGRPVSLLFRSWPSPVGSRASSGVRSGRALGVGFSARKSIHSRGGKSPERFAFRVCPNLGNRTEQEERRRRRRGGAALFRNLSHPARIARGGREFSRIFRVRENCGGRFWILSRGEFCRFGRSFLRAQAGAPPPAMSVSSGYAGAPAGGFGSQSGPVLGSSGLGKNPDGGPGIFTDFRKSTTAASFGPSSAANSVYSGGRFCSPGPRSQRWPFRFQRSNGRDSGRVRVPKWPRVGFFRIGQKS